MATTMAAAGGSDGGGGLGQVLLRRLEMRNRLEVDALRGVVGEYLSLCSEKRSLREACAALDKSNKALAEEKGQLKEELLHKDDSEGKAALAGKLQEANAELKEEVMQSYKENARIAQELAAKVNELTVLREEQDRASTEVDKLGLTVGELGERNKDLLTQLEDEKNACRVLKVELDTLIEEKQVRAYRASERERAEGIPHPSRLLAAPRRLSEKRASEPSHPLFLR